MTLREYLQTPLGHTEFGRMLLVHLGLLAIAHRCTDHSILHRRALKINMGITVTVIFVRVCKICTKHKSIRAAFAPSTW